MKKTVSFIGPLLIIAMLQNWGILKLKRNVLSFLFTQQLKDLLTFVRQDDLIKKPIKFVAYLFKMRIKPRLKSRL